MSVREVLSRIFIKSDDASSPEDLDLKSVQKELTGKDKELARKLDIWVVNVEKKHEDQLAENIKDNKSSIRSNERDNTKTKKARSKTKQIDSKNINKGFEISDE